jgi:DNA-binding MarR family transcriptional regulator
VTSTFSRAIDRMAAGGWVVRHPNPDSGREVLVAVTPAGRELVERVTASRRAELVRILGDLPDDRLAELASALNDFAQAAGEPSLDDLLPIGG